MYPGIDKCTYIYMCTCMYPGICICMYIYNIYVHISTQEKGDTSRPRRPSRRSAETRAGVCVCVCVCVCARALAHATLNPNIT